jgi:hypothetical protein
MDTRIVDASDSTWPDYVDSKGTVGLVSNEHQGIESRHSRRDRVMIGANGSDRPEVAAAETTHWLLSI